MIEEILTALTTLEEGHFPRAADVFGALVAEDLNRILASVSGGDVTRLPASPHA